MDDDKLSKIAAATKPAEELPLVPSVLIENGSEGDILGDVKWVYANLAQIMRVRPGSSEKSPKPNTKILKQAPSNGAIALAHYAFDDPQAFFEKFVVKILPKDITPAPTKTEEDLKAELDPGLDELKKWMK